MKKLIIISSLLMFFCAHIAQIPKKPFVWAYENVLSNAQVQKYGSAVCFIASRYYDATADAVAIQGHNQAMYPNGGFKIYGGSRYDHWHLYKNNAVWLLMASCVLKGLELGQGHTKVSTIAKRTLGECAIAWDIWQWRKHYILSGHAFDFSKEQNEHLIVLPLPTNDRYIGMSGQGIFLLQSGLMMVGIAEFTLN